MSSPSILAREAVSEWRRLRVRARARRLSRLDPPRVRQLVVMLQSACGLHCRMCDLWLETPSALPREKVLALLRSPALAPGAAIHWTGGEPFLYPDFAGLYAEARALRPGARMSISSSGVPAEAALAFLDSRPDLRGAALVFSYDGAGTHDAQRGAPGAEKELLKLLAEVRRRVPRARVAARMTITPENAHAVHATFLKTREVGVSVQYMTVSVHEHYTNGVRSRGDEPFRFSPETLAVLEAGLARVLPELSLWSEREEIRHVIELLDRVRRREALAVSPAEAGGPPDCPVPSQSAFVRSDGAVLTCRSCAPIGSVHDGGLESAWRSEAAAVLRRDGCARCEPRYSEF